MGQLPWYANLFYLAGLVSFMLKKSLITAVLAASAVAIALTAFGITEMPRNEAGDMTTVVGLGPAFYLWVSSMLVILMAAVLSSLKPRAPNPTLP